MVKKKESFIVKRNLPTLTDEEIEKHKDFSKLLNANLQLKYKDATKPLYKNKKLMLFVLLLSTVLLVLYIDSVDTNRENAFGNENKKIIQHTIGVGEDSLTKTIDRTSEK
jgi:hypothetical protein